MNTTETTADRDELRENQLIQLRARCVTGTNVATGRFPRSARPGVVAKALASRLNLPVEGSWSLRDSRVGRFLDDSRSLGEQLEDSADVDIVPRAHLG